MWDFGRIPKNPPLEQMTIEPPLKRLSIRPLSTNQDSPASRACSIPGQLLFTVLGPGHVHEESGAYHLSNRAYPRIPS